MTSVSAAGQKPRREGKPGNSPHGNFKNIVETPIPFLVVRYNKLQSFPQKISTGCGPAKQCLQRLKFNGNCSEQLYPVQPFPSCETVSAEDPYNKSLHHHKS